ncbi:BBT_HP_G0132180.mRNA.1.CDS.1 [Saccharomyces cerevisiae]|nr:BBT_HP_G0132180.mRNA.1.CDS.1 [Saccharomyces cerevisiae]CAI6975846.1 BBT_HP_G0132180.mRNA.1.CDS.1 [Saccharomyces cerevisiae]
MLFQRCCNGSAIQMGEHASTEQQDIVTSCVVHFYGEWGPRRPVLNKGDSSFYCQRCCCRPTIFSGTFCCRQMAGGQDAKTMNKEWQLKSDEYLKSKNANPWGGYSGPI